MKKRILSILLAMCLVLTMLPTFALSAFASDDITVKVNDGSAVQGHSLQNAIETQAGVTPAAVTSLEIVSGRLYEGDYQYFMTSIGCGGYENMTDVVISNAVTHEFPYGTVALFQYSSKLKNATIGFEGIDDYMFLDCTSLESAAFPKATRISYDAVEDCTSLKTMSFPATPPTVSENKNFWNIPTKVQLVVIEEDGTPLAGTALANARLAYKSVNDGNTTDNRWYGLKIYPEYNITYHLDGGTNVSTNPAIYTEADTISLADATKSGHSFSGWYDAQTDGKKVTEIAVGSTGDKALYARFIAKTAPAITISQADVVFGIPVDPIITADSTGTQTVEYKLTAAADSTYTTTTPTTVGNYSVRVTVATTDIHLETTQTATFAITPKPAVVLPPVVSNNAPNAVIDNTSEIVLEAALTEADKQIIANGADYSIYLRVKNVAPPATDKTTVESALGKMKVGMFLDVSLIKNINGTESNIETLSNKIRIAIDVPAELLKTDRAFSIIRVHNDKAEVLVDLDTKLSTVTFETDKFSTYALTYVDKDGGIPTPGTGDTAPVVSIPETGDTVPMAPIAGLALATVVIISILIKKKERV